MKKLLHPKGFGAPQLKWVGFPKGAKKLGKGFRGNHIGAQTSVF